MTAPRLISHQQLETMKGISYSKPHLWRLEKAGDFPARVPLGPGRYAYVESEVDEYIERKISERNAGAKVQIKRKVEKG